MPELAALALLEASLDVACAALVAAQPELMRPDDFEPSPTRAPTVAEERAPPSHLRRSAPHGAWCPVIPLPVGPYDLGNIIRSARDGGRLRRRYGPLRCLRSQVAADASACRRAGAPGRGAWRSCRPPLSFVPLSFRRAALSPDRGASGQRRVRAAALLVAVRSFEVAPAISANLASTSLRMSAAGSGSPTGNRIVPLLVS